MADRYLLESGAPDGYLLEDGTGVYLLDAYPGYLSVPGSSGNYADTPDNAALDITGDIDLRALILPNAWNSTGFDFRSVLAKKDSASDADLSYHWGLWNNGSGATALTIGWKESGGTARGVVSTIGDLQGTSGALWIRAVLDVDNGAAQYEVKFYTSTDSIETAPAAVSWSQYGATVTGATGVTSIFNSISPVELGVNNTGTEKFWAGKIFYAEIRNGIAGTIVANPDFRYDCQQDSGTQLTDDQGRVFTVKGTATWATPLPCPSGAATVTPAVVAAVTTVPTPTVLAAAKVTPTVVAVVAAVPTPAVLAAAKVTPTVVATVTTVPTPTITAASVVTPLVIAQTVTAPTPVVTAPGAVTPAVVAAVVTVPTPIPSISAVVTPAVVAAVTTVPTPTITAEAVTSPAVVATVVAVPTPVTLAAALVSPATVAMTVTIPTPLLVGYLNLTGVSGDYASTPDHASLDITGDIDLRALIEPAVWNSTGFDFRPIFAKRESTSTDDLAYQWGLWNPGGGVTALTLGWEEGGGADRGVVSTIDDLQSIPGALWVRVTLDVDNGAGQYEVKFYTSADPVDTDPASVTWSQHGATVTGTTGVTSIKSTVSPVELGSYNDGTEKLWPGHFLYAEIRNGINGTIVANPDWRYDCQLDSSTQLTDDQGRVWTVIGGATWVNPAACPLVAATVTPAVVAVVSTVPTPTVAIPATVAPAVVATVVTVPAPVVTAPGAVTPAVVPLTVTVDTPTVLAAATVTPSVVAATTTVPTPTILVAPTVTPAVVATVVTVPAPSVLAASVVEPAVVATTTTVPTPTITVAPTVTPATVVTAVTVDTPTVTAEAVVTPDTVVTVVAVDTPTVTVGAASTPATVEVVTTVPTPQVVAASVVTPEVVATVVTIPTPTVQGGTAVNPDVIVTTVTVPTPSVTAVGVAAPATVAAVTTIPTPTVLAGVLAQPAVVGMTVTVPDPTVQGAVTVQPATVTLTTTVPNPTVTVVAAGVVSPATVVVTVTVPPPTGGVEVIFSPPGDGIDCGPADRTGSFTTVNSTGVLAELQLTSVGSANHGATVTNGDRSGRMRRVRIRC